ncbi:hypothetical protein GCM10011588_25620 [Nocardia jinanensis]|uniref:Uncharacterized protein n=1 Tax=Nocardia jinanensis TaxID=382504 RepID=A0A917RIR5_9NOCA|nr:hypothetical protein GCM10011588_25620 [Nocardia jinanensis]
MCGRPLPYRHICPGAQIERGPHSTKPPTTLILRPAGADRATKAYRDVVVERDIDIGPALAYRLGELFDLRTFTLEIEYRTETAEDRTGVPALAVRHRASLPDRTRRHGSAPVFR